MEAMETEQTERRGMKLRPCGSTGRRPMLTRVCSILHQRQLSFSTEHHLPLLCWRTSAAEELSSEW